MSTIAFPGLGLKFNINPVAFSVFGKDVYWYGIIISAAFLITIILAQRDSKKFNIESEYIVDLVLFAIPAAIIGARVYYVVFRWQDYQNNPGEMFAIWHGGLAIYGGILAAMVVAYVFAKKKKIGVFKLFDFLAPYLALGQAIGRWGNFINQEAYGAITSLPWRMQITASDNISRIEVHPTFLYESLWNLGVYIFLIWYRKRNKISGEIFMLYMILYGLGRFWIEGLRTDSLMWGGFRVSQILAGIFVLCFTIILISTRKHVLCRLDVNKNDKTTLTETNK